MQQTREFVSQAKADVSAQMQKAITPKPVRQYDKSEIADFKRMIASATWSRDELKKSLVEANKQLETLRQCLYEAEMQHAPIEVLPPVNGPRQKSKPSNTTSTVRISTTNATKILNALVKMGLVDSNNLPG